MLRRGFALLMLFVLTVLAPRVALADQPGAHTVQVAVLSFDSEDAGEQADALTGAVRSRIRAAQGWSLIETTQSLGMLTAALRCPARPTPECQAKLSDQLKSDRYIWGLVAKGPTQDQVTAEIHLYQKGQPDTVLKESYADNLKDANDDTLKKIAARVVERFGGTTIGIVIVRASEQTGDVVVDGGKRIPLDKGTARIELAAGGHSIEVSSAAGASTKRNVLVTAGRETTLDMSAAPTTEPPPEPGNPRKTRKIIGGVSMGVGAVLGVIAVQQLLHYVDLQDRGDKVAAKVDEGRECRAVNAECADIDSKSKSASALAIVLGGVSAAAIGVGAYLFFVEQPSSEKQVTAKAAPPRPRARIVPSATPSSGSLMLVGSF